jgi:hypothetical protein
MIRRQWAIAALLAALVLLGPRFARAEGLLFPELGLGAGPAIVDGYSSRAAAVELKVGYDWELDGLIGVGFLGGLEWESARWQVERGWERFSLGSMLTLSIGHYDVLPFVRVGLGPTLGFTMLERDVGARPGLGLTAEAAVGFRSIVELYAQASALADSSGLAPSLTAGFRINVWIFDVLFGGGPAFEPEPHHSSSPIYRAPHDAVPAGAP